VLTVPSRRRLLAAAPAVVVGAAALVWAALMTHIVRGLWFFGDDFEFLLHRSITFGGDRGLLVPHNEHWSTIPILLFRLNFAIFGLHHYLPYGLLPVLGHVAASALIYFVLRRSDIGPWVAALVAMVVIFLAGGAGGENTLWDFQVGFLGSCVLGLVALSLFVSRLWGRIGWIAGVVALVLGLMCSGMGIVMAAWSGVYLFVRDGVRTAVLTMLAPGLVYLVWYAAYGHGHHGAPPGDSVEVPDLAMRGLSHIWAAATDMPQAGPLVLALMVLAIVVPRHTEHLFALAASGLVTAVAAYFLFGFTRAGMGAGATLASRYVYFGIVLTAPALAAGAQVLANRLVIRPPRVLIVAWLVVAAVIVSVGATSVIGLSRTSQDKDAGIAPRIVAAEQLVSSGQRLLRNLPSPQLNPDITVDALKRPSVRAALPDVVPDRRARLDVALNLQVDVGGQGHGLAPATGLRFRHFATPSAGNRSRTDAPGCEVRSALGGAVIEVAPSAGGSELVVTVSGKTLDTGLVQGSVRSAVTRWAARPGQPLVVSTTAQDATLEVFVPPGRVTVCSS
jgi:hypothetical protein